VELSQLKEVGDSKIFTTVKVTRGKGAIQTNDKLQAKRILGEPTAEWTMKATQLGVRVTRIR
jgi:hypothetical protein